jgi:hypothetical protein
LILSNNKIKNLNKDLLKPLGSVKSINVSSNLIEKVDSNLLNNLKKLEVIDLSRNKIYEMHEYSFYKLNSLKSLYIYENSPNMTIENGTFYELNSIESIYLSKTIINSQTSSIFINLFKQKNKNLNTKILNVTYLKSLNLISFDETDCNLTLYFIRENVHFNLRTEIDWFQYVSDCEDDEIKIKEKVSKRKDAFTRIQFTSYGYFILRFQVLLFLFLFSFMLHTKN